MALLAIKDLWNLNEDEDLIIFFLQPPVASSLLGPNILFCTLLSMYQ
jgi:hypothetical protein